MITFITAEGVFIGNNYYTVLILLDNSVLLLLHQIALFQLLFDLI